MSPSLLVRLLPALFLLASCAPSASDDDDSADGDAVDDDDSGDDDDSALAADGWDNFARDFFAAYCTACHDGAGAPQDFSSYEEVVDWAEGIRCGTAATTQAGCPNWPPAQQFPIGNGPRPAPEERDRLIAWIDAGLAE